MGFSMWSSDSYRDGSIEYLSNNLRWFYWCRYPWESLPTKFEPKKLVHLELRRSELRQLWKETKMYFPRLRTLDLCGSENLMETPDFREMPNLEYLNLQGCRSLEEVDDSLGYCDKLIELDLGCCLRLKRFPCVNVESLEYLDLYRCFSLEIFPEIRGRSKSELEIYMGYSGIRELPSFIQYLTHITELDLSGMKNLVALPSSIGMLISLVELNVSNCSELESFPEEIGDLENLEKLDAENTLISRPPSSIVRLNKLKFLSFEKAIFGDETDEEIIGEEIGGFAFPQVNEGLRSLETLNLRYCNLIDEGLPEDIGCLSALEELNLWGNNFEYLPRSIAQFGALRFLDVSYCERLKESPGFMGMPNLETLDLSNCMNLEEVHHSLRFLKKLWRLNLCNCKRLKRFPTLCIDSLVFLDLKRCSSLEKFPEILGSMNLQLESGTRCLDLGGLENLVTLPSSIGMWKSLVGLYLWDCSNLEILPEEIGDLENLEKLDASNTLIGQPPPSLVRLNKLKFLIFDKRKSKVGLKDGVCFVFPQVNDGLHSLKDLDLSYCNLIDGGLPEDIGSLSSLEELNLGGNNFEQLPQSIAQLSALQSLDLSDCKRLKELPEFPQQLDTIYAHWSNDWICNSLFQNISSLQHDISASDSLSPRVFTTRRNIPSWFHHRGTGRSVSVNLPENWYVPDNFLGFAVCYSGRLIETTAQLFPLCDDGVSSMTQKLTLSNHSECVEPKIHFFLVSFAGKWGMSKANGKTPNDYGRIMLFFGELKDFGLRLLYKDEPELDVLLQMSENSDEPELEALLQMRENNDEPTEHGIMTRTSRYENSEHHDSVNNEASCSSQIVTFLIFVGTLFLRICSNE